MRLYPGKENCLFLDYGNNVIEHGPIDAIPTKRAKAENSEPGDAPMKECRKCHEIVHASKKECPECGFEFPDNSEINHDWQAYEGAVLSSQITPEIFKVTNVTYNRHVKMGKKDSLKVTYWSYLKIFNEWLCVEHFGMVGEGARKEIRQMGGSAKTVTEALTESSSYKTPKEIHAVKSGKYWRIVKKVY
jgi:DNA repair protein RadD